jgi:uncharacterized protein DUF4431
MKVLLIAFILLGANSSVSAQECVKCGTTVSLAGTIRARVFPGPPNYESIKRGDRKERAIILRLAAPMCTAGDDPAGVDVPENNIRDLQLVITNAAHWKVVERRLGKRVAVSGSLFHSHTGHHRTKVLIKVDELKPSRAR